MKHFQTVQVSLSRNDIEEGFSKKNKVLVGLNVKDDTQQEHHDVVLEEGGSSIVGDEQVTGTEEDTLIEDWSTTDTEDHPRQSNFKILASLSFCQAVDAVETLAFGSVLTSYVNAETGQRLDEDKGISGYLTSGVFVGMFIGGLLSGPLANRVGRRSVLIGSMFINGTSGLISSFSPHFPGHTIYWLLGFRILAGIGVGGSIPCTYSLAAELSEVKSRGFNVSLLVVFWMLGSIFTSLTAWLVLSPVDNTNDWPIFLRICALPAFIALVLINFFVYDIPSTYSNLAKNSDQPHEEESPFGLSFLTMLFIYCFLWYSLSFGSYGVGMWIGDVFRDLGYEDPYGVVFLYTLASIPGNLLGLYLVERSGRKLLFTIGMILSGFSAFAFSLVFVLPSLVILSACVFNAMVALAWVALSVMSSEAFPTQYNTTSLGIAAACGRLGSVSANLANPFLLKQHLILTTAGGILLLGALIGSFFLVDRTGKVLY